MAGELGFCAKGGRCAQAPEPGPLRVFLNALSSGRVRSCGTPKRLWENSFDADRSMFGENHEAGCSLKESKWREVLGQLPPPNAQGFPTSLRGVWTSQEHFHWFGAGVIRVEIYLDLPTDLPTAQLLMHFHLEQHEPAKFGRTFAVPGRSSYLLSRSRLSNLKGTVGAHIRGASCLNSTPNGTT